VHLGHQPLYDHVRLLWPHFAWLTKALCSKPTLPTALIGVYLYLPSRWDELQRLWCRFEIDLTEPGATRLKRVLPATHQQATLVEQFFCKY
jgi:hypothetical protein